MTHSNRPGSAGLRARARRALRSPARTGVAMLCIAVTAAAVIAPPGASAQTLNYDIGLDLPAFVRLWYWDTIPLTIEASELTTAYFGDSSISAGSLNLTTAFSGGTMVVDAAIGDVVDDDLVTDPDGGNVWIQVSNAWALQSASFSGQTQVSIKLKKRNANEGSGAKIKANDAMVGAFGSVGRSITVDDTGYFSYFWGDAYLQLDLSKAEAAGTYTGIVVEITAENI